MMTSVALMSITSPIANPISIALLIVGVHETPGSNKSRVHREKKEEHVTFQSDRR